MLQTLVIFIISLLALIKGADIFIDTSARIARRFGISDFIIGLTLVAIGTSIPELGVAIISSLNKNSSIILGNVIGSNIANIGWVLGIAIIFSSSLFIKDEMFGRNSIILLGTTILFFLLSLDGKISFFDALFLFLLLIFYLNYYFLFESKQPKFQKIIKPEKYLKVKIKAARFYSDFKLLFQIKNLSKRIKSKLFGEAGKEFLFLVISVTLIVYGAKYIVYSAVNMASIFGIPESIIALVMISLGTTLPELSTSILAAKKGHGKMIMGVVIGSNIVNILLIIGISGMMSELVVSNITLFLLMPVMIFFSILLFVFIGIGKNLNRTKGVVLLALYLLFLVVSFFVGVFL